MATANRRNARTTSTRRDLDGDERRSAVIGAMDADWEAIRQYREWEDHTARRNRHRSKFNLSGTYSTQNIEYRAANGLALGFY